MMTFEDTQLNDVSNYLNQEWERILEKKTLENLLVLKSCKMSIHYTYLYTIEIDLMYMAQ